MQCNKMHCKNKYNAIKWITINNWLTKKLKMETTLMQCNKIQCKNEKKIQCNKMN